MSANFKTIGCVLFLASALSVSFGSTAIAETVAPPGAGPAHTPDEILQRCEDRFAKIVARRETGNEKIADRSLSQIQQLLDDGDPGAANALVRQRCRRIQSFTRQAVRKISKITRRSAKAIKKANGDSAILEALRTASREALHDVRTSRRDQVSRIKAAAAPAPTDD